MYNENYSIIFSSMTGNTRKLADKIHEILPKESCDYFGTADAQGIKSELLYIGFWTDKGNADSDTLDFLSKLKIRRYFCSEQPVLEEVMHIFKGFLAMLKAPLIQVTLL